VRVVVLAAFRGCLLAFNPGTTSAGFASFAGATTTLLGFGLLFGLAFALACTAGRSAQNVKTLHAMVQYQHS